MDIFSEDSRRITLGVFSVLLVILLVASIKLPKILENISLLTTIYFAFLICISLYIALWHKNATEYCLKPYNHVEDKFVILSFAIAILMSACFLINGYHWMTYYLYISFGSPVIIEVIRMIFMIVIFLSTMTVYGNSVDLLKKYQTELKLETL